MLDKLNAIEAKYSQIEARLGASETYNDPELVAKLNKEQAELQPLVEVFRTYRRALDAKAQAEEMMSDPELKELAQADVAAARAALSGGALGRGLDLPDGQIDAVGLVDADDLDLDLLSLAEMVAHLVHIGIGDL